MGQPGCAEIHRVCERIGSRSYKHSRRSKLAFLALANLIATSELTLVPHILDHTNQLSRVDVEHLPSGRVVAETLMVAGEAKNVFHAQNIRAEDISLDSKAVAVSAGHLYHRLQPAVQQQLARGDAADADDSGLIVRQVHRVDLTSQEISLLVNQAHIGTLGRAKFRGYHKMTSREQTL